MNTGPNDVFITSEVKNAKASFVCRIVEPDLANLAPIASANIPIMKAIHTPRRPQISILYPIECGIVSFLFLMLFAITSPRVANIANLINDKT